MSERIPTLWKKNPKILVAGGYPLPEDHPGGVADIKRNETLYMRNNIDPDDPDNFIKVWESSPRMWGDDPWENEESFSLGYSNPADSTKHKTVSSWVKPDSIEDINKLWKYLHMADVIDYHQLTIDYFGFLATLLYKGDPLNYQKVFVANEHADASEAHMKRWKMGVTVLSFLGKVDATVLNNDDLRDRYIRIYGRELERLGVRVEMIPNPVVLADFESKGIKMRNWGGEILDDNTLVIFSIGRLEERKGFKHLLHTIKALLDDPEVPKNFKLAIAGSGPDEAELKATAISLGINDHVIFMGRISEAEKREAFDGADIVCLFSKENESQGNTIAESQAAVNATLVGKAYKKSVLTQGKNSVVQLETEEVAESKMELKKLIMDAQWRKLIQEAGAQYVKQFDIAPIMARRIKLFNQIHADKMLAHKRNRFVVRLQSAYSKAIMRTAKITVPFFSTPDKADALILP